MFKIHLQTDYSNKAQGCHELNRFNAGEEFDLVLDKQEAHNK